MKEKDFKTLKYLKIKHNLTYANSEKQTSRKIRKYFEVNKNKNKYCEIKTFFFFTNLCLLPN